MSGAVHDDTIDPGNAGGGLELVISRVLRSGVVLSLITMVLGIIIGVVDGSFATSSGDLDSLISLDAGESFRLSDAWDSLLSGGALGIMTLGLCVLIATPMVRVVASLVGYARSRDWAYLGLTTAVVVALVISMLIGSAVG